MSLNDAKKIVLIAFELLMITDKFSSKIKAIRSNDDQCYTCNECKINFRIYWK